MSVLVGTVHTYRYYFVNVLGAFNFSSESEDEEQEDEEQEDEEQNKSHGWYLSALPRNHSWLLAD
jgi:hypothetical protein